MVGQTFFSQMKLRRSKPRELFDWLNGISVSTEAANRVGILVLDHPRVKDALVVMRWSDWVQSHQQSIRMTGNGRDVELQ